MNLIEALETSFNVVERLEDRRIALRLFDCAQQLNHLFVSPERLARTAALMRNDTLKLGDAIALKRELDESRPFVHRALGQLARLTRFEMSRVVFRPGELSALSSLGMSKQLIRTEIDDLLRAYAWHRANRYPDLGAPAEAEDIWEFDSKATPPLSPEQLATRTTELEQSAQRLAFAIERAFDHLTADNVRRRAPLTWSHCVAAIFGGVVLFAAYVFFGEVIEPYVDAARRAIAAWIASFDR